MRFQKSLLAAAAVLSIAAPAAAMAAPYNHDGGRVIAVRHEGERFGGPVYRGGFVHRDYGYRNFYRFHHHRFHRFEERRGW